MYRPINFNSLNQLLSDQVSDEPSAFEMPSGDLDALATRLGPNTDLSRLQTDLTHTIRRFARNQANYKAMPTRRIATRQLSKLETQTTQLLNNLDELDPKVLALLSQNYDQYPLATPPMSLDDPYEWDPIGEIQHERIIWILSWLLRSIRATEKEITASLPWERKNDPLERLIEDLKHIFDTETGTRAASASYYNGSKGVYEGAFYEFSKEVIQRFRPECFYSDGAWGNIIARALKRQ